MILNIRGSGKTHRIGNWWIYTWNQDFFMKSNKVVRATLCLEIYTTWRNKTYIVRGSQKSFHLGMPMRNFYWIFRIIYFNAVLYKYRFLATQLSEENRWKNLLFCCCLNYVANPMERTSAYRLPIRI